MRCYRMATPSRESAKKNSGSSSSFIASTTIPISEALRDELRTAKAVRGVSYEQMLRDELDLPLDDE
jgi:hypothetical protein